jgi:tetratricopeptide (TPR) repeat protein
LAHSYGALGEEEEARGAIERAVALGPEQFYVHYFVGLAWLNLGEEDKAIDAFRRAVSLGYPVALLKPDPQLESIRYNDEFRTLTGG